MNIEGDHHHVYIHYTGADGTPQRLAYEERIAVKEVLEVLGITRAIFTDTSSGTLVECMYGVINKVTCYAGFIKSLSKNSLIPYGEYLSMK